MKIRLLTLLVFLVFCTSALAISVEEIYADEDIYVADKIIDLKAEIADHEWDHELDSLTCRGISLMLPAIANGAQAKYTNLRIALWTSPSSCPRGVSHDGDESYRWYPDEFNWGFDSTYSADTTKPFVTALSGRVNTDRVLQSDENSSEHNSTVTLLENVVSGKRIKSNYDPTGSVHKSCGMCGEYYTAYYYAFRTIQTGRITNVVHKQIKSMTFTNCTFPFGLLEIFSPTLFPTGGYGPVTFGVPTKFINCTFSNYLEIDCVGSGSVIFENCSYSGNRDLTLNSCSGTLDLSQWSGSSISGNGQSTLTLTKNWPNNYVVYSRNRKPVQLVTSCTGFLFLLGSFGSDDQNDIVAIVMCSVT